MELEFPVVLFWGDPHVYSIETHCLLLNTACCFGFESGLANSSAWWAVIRASKTSLLARITPRQSSYRSLLLTPHVVKKRSVLVAFLAVLNLLAVLNPG